MRQILEIERGQRFQTATLARWLCAERASQWIGHHHLLVRLVQGRAALLLSSPDQPTTPRRAAELSIQRLAAIKLQKYGIGCASKLVVAGHLVRNFDGQAQQTDQHFLLRFARECAKGAKQLLGSVCHATILTARLYSPSITARHSMAPCRCYFGGDLPNFRVAPLIRPARDPQFAQ